VRETKQQPTIAEMNLPLEARIDEPTATDRPAAALPDTPDVAALMRSPDRFINRELSWLSLNQRVLEEAENATTRGSATSPYFL